MKPEISENPPSLKNQRSQDFSSIYANNVAFETSVFDLKLIFGQLDQALGIIDQHTAITIAWPVVKLGLYNLAAQIAAYEIVYGKIRLSSDVLPPAPLPPPDEHKDNPLFQKVYDRLKELHEEFIKSA